MAHQVYYAMNNTFCQEYTTAGNKSHNQEETWKAPFILMIDRGDCTFVTKVRNAQKRGALGVILADTIEGEHVPIVADDGSGHDVSIPSVMMKKSDADHIKDMIVHKKQPVVAEMAWHWPRHEKEAFISFWHTPINTRSADFLTNFSKIALQLGDHMKFHPHYYILNGAHLHCNGNADKEGDGCYDLCTNNGRYCAAGHHGVSGKKVVIESLRRMCISEHYPGKPWWDYLDHFTEWCMEEKDEEYFANPDCLEDAFKHAAVDKETIETCMKDSGEVTSDTPNSMLSSALENIEEYGVFETPTVLINDVPLRWTPLSPKSVFDMFCTAFAYGKAPHACYQCASCGDPVACISRDPMQCLADDGKEHEDTPSKGSSGNKHKKGHHWRWFFIFCFIGGAAGYVYYKRRMEGGDGFGSYTLADAFMSDST